MQGMVWSHEELCHRMQPTTTRFVCTHAKAVSQTAQLVVCHPAPSTYQRRVECARAASFISATTALYQPYVVRRQLAFPDPGLVQYDCGKLQRLATLLRDLKQGGHRCLIFTQMTRMLDVLEVFLNFHGYIYLRLDGSTKIQDRQLYMEKFNNMPKYFCFILSTRSGGVGINLVGADTVIFYDSDWNPAMDKQAQDRCHRIGQTREVHIYRLISERTVEENILKKSNQKRHLENVVVKDGFFTPDYFKKVDVRDLLSSESAPVEKEKPGKAKGKAGGEKDERISHSEWLEATKGAEEEADVLAADRAKEEEALDEQEFDENAPLQLLDEDGAVLPGQPMSIKPDDEVIDFLRELTPIQKYALRQAELWDPLAAGASAEPEAIPQTEWELEMLTRLKDQEEDKMDEDDEVLYYEVSGSSSQVYHYQAQLLEEHGLPLDMELYGPPSPDDNATCGGHRDDVFAAKEARSRKRLEKENAAFNESARKLFGNNATLLGVRGPKSADLEGLDDEDEAIVNQPDSDSDDNYGEDSELGGLRHRTHYPLKRVRVLINVKDTDAVRAEADEGLVTHILAQAKINWRNDQVGPPKRRGTDASNGLFRGGPPQKRGSMPRRPGQHRKNFVQDKDGPQMMDLIWTSDEEGALAWAVSEYGCNWHAVSDLLNSSPLFRYFRRSPKQCMDTWTNTLSQREGGRPPALAEGQNPPFEYVKSLMPNESLHSYTAWSYDLTPSGGLPLLTSTAPETSLVVKKPPLVKNHTKGGRDANLDDPTYRFSIILKYQKVTNNKSLSIQTKSQSDANSRPVTQHDSHNKAIVHAKGTPGKGCKPHEVVCVNPPKAPEMNAMNMRGGSGSLTKMDRVGGQQLMMRPNQTSTGRPVQKKIDGKVPGSSTIAGRFAPNQTMQGTDAAGYRYDQSGQPVSPAQKKGRIGKTTTASPRKNKPLQTAPQPQMQVPQQLVRPPQMPPQPMMHQPIPPQMQTVYQQPPQVTVPVYHTPMVPQMHVVQIPQQMTQQVPTQQVPQQMHQGQRPGVQQVPVPNQMHMQQTQPQLQPIPMQQLPVQQLQQPHMQQPMQQSFTVQQLPTTQMVNMQMPQAAPQMIPAQMMLNAQGQPIMMQQQPAPARQQAPPPAGARQM